MVPQIALNHLGLTVPDIDRAIDWYGQVMGFRLIFRRILQVRPDVPEVSQIFGPSFKSAHQAHLVTANGIGLELFQFLDPPVTKPSDNFDFARAGIFHLCVTDPDVEGLVSRVVENGGRKRTGVWKFLEGRPYKLVYCEDPFGNVIEIFSHTYAEVFANMPGWHSDEDERN